MAWLDEDWTHRVPFAVDVASGSTNNGYISMPEDLEVFWSHVGSAGADIRVTGPDGRTLLTHKAVATNGTDPFAASARSGIIQFAALPTEAGVCFGYIYFGNPDATSTAGTPSQSGALVGRVHAGSIVGPRVVVRPPAPRSTRPSKVIQKNAGEALRVWWDLREVLAPAPVPIAGRTLWEEPSAVVLTEVRSGLVAQGTMVDTTKTVVIDGWVSTWLKAGTTDTDYTAVVQVRTSDGRTIEARALVRVYDLGA